MRYQVISKRRAKKANASFNFINSGTGGVFRSSRKELCIKHPGVGVTPTGRGVQLPQLASYYKLKNLSRRELIKARSWAMAWV